MNHGGPRKEPVKSLHEFEPIPSYFFEKGEYEVWAAKSYSHNAPIVKITGDVCLETAKAFNWPRKEIRLKWKRQIK